MTTSSLIWVAVLISGVLLLIGVTIYQRRVRKIAIQIAAARLGLKQIKGRLFSRTERKRLPLLHRGLFGKYSNALADKSATTRVLIFDYSYIFGLPLLADTRYHQTVAAFRVPGTVPDFALAPATNLDRVLKSYDWSGVVLDWDPEFLRRYWLRGPDEHAIRTFFSSGLTTRIRELDPTTRWSIEKGGEWLLIYIHGCIFNPPDMWPIVTALAQIVGAQSIPVAVTR